MDAGAKGQGRRAGGVFQAGALGAQLIQGVAQGFAILLAEHGELLATQAPEQGVGEGGGEGPGEGDQRRVATGVAMFVVDPFEVIQIDHRHAQVAAAGLGLGEQLLTVLIEGAAVVQPGEGIELRSLLECAHQVAALQGRHDPAVELLRAERLAQKIVGAVLDKHGAERALGVGRQAENDQLVALHLLPQELDQFETTHARHAVVHQQQVDIRLLTEDAQGLIAVAGVDDLVAVRGQHIADVVAGGLAVLGDEDLHLAVAFQAVQQAESVLVGVLAFLEYIVDHALEQHLVAALLVVAAAEHDAGQVVAHHQVDDLAIRGVRQVEVDDGGEEQAGGGFQHHPGFIQAGAEDRLEAGLLAEQMLQDFQHQGAVFHHQDIAHGLLLVRRLPAYTTGRARVASGP